MEFRSKGYRLHKIDFGWMSPVTRRAVAHPVCRTLRLVKEYAKDRRSDWKLEPNRYLRVGVDCSCLRR